MIDITDNTHENLFDLYKIFYQSGEHHIMKFLFNAGWHGSPNGVGSHSSELTEQDTSVEYTCGAKPAAGILPQFPRGNTKCNQIMAEEPLLCPLSSSYEFPNLMSKLEKRSACSFELPQEQ